MVLQRVFPRAISKPLRRCLLGERPNRAYRRPFHQSTPLNVVKPYILADIGEGITECQIISWSVKPGDKVEQFDTICEVSSDKATVEITSRFDGTIKELHYEENDVAVVGKPLLDIDIDIDIDDELSAGVQTGDPAEVESARKNSAKAADSSRSDDNGSKSTLDPSVQQRSPSLGPTGSPSQLPLERSGDFEATPAVRHLLKRDNISATDISGTGKGGRITKEDVERYLAGSREESFASAPSKVEKAASPTAERDVTIRLSPTENQMFKAMTRSLSIPHFLYTHSVSVSAFNELRAKLVTSKVLDYLVGPKHDSSTAPKLTLLPFVMKALSRVFLQFPKLNSHLDASDANTPKLTLKAGHNFGIAIDTPQGLLVPVIKNVQDHSILSLAAEIKRMSDIARAGKLKPDDFQGATFTVSNIGSVGAGCQAVSPVIVAPMVGILGMGRMSDVPVWGKDDAGIERLVKERQVILSWSADHRIIDGATVAKAADMLAALLSRPESLGLILK